MPLTKYINGMTTTLGNMKTATLGNIKTATLANMKTCAKKVMFGLYCTYMWWVLAPFSEYPVLELPLLLIRIFVTAMILLGCVHYKTEYMFGKTWIPISAAYVMELGYFLIQDEATETYEVRSHLPHSYNEFWWKQHTFIVLVQAGFVCLSDYSYRVAEKLGIHFKWIIGGYLLLQIMCSFGYLLFFLSPIHYYFYKILIFGLCYKDLMHTALNDELHEADDRRTRDEPICIEAIIMYCSFFYYLSIFYIDCMLLGTDETYRTKYLIRFIDACTTSFLTLMSLLVVFILLLNCVVLITELLVTSNVNVQEVFDDQVCISSIALYVQSGILSEPQRSDDRSFVVLFVFFAIFCQMWDLSERLFMVLLKKGQGSWPIYLGVTLSLITIASGPTYMAYRLAPVYHYDIWSFFNITGITISVSRCAVSLVEYSLIALSWHVEDPNDTLSDAIYYTRVTKFVVIFFFYGLLGYYRITSHYFAYRFISTLVLSVMEFVLVSKVVLGVEWKFYQSRQKLVQQIDNIANATEDQLVQNDDDCSICITRIKTGKRLVCGHTFHRGCLRKWFQVRPTCPNCNAIVLINWVQLRTS